MQSDRNISSAIQFRKMRSENSPPSQNVCSRKRSNNGRKVGNGVSPEEGATVKGDSA